MDSRKVQFTGGSSYIISLPKKWVTEHGIQKNDRVAIRVQEDGNLLISANVTDEVVMSKTLTADVSDGEILMRRLVALYIEGYNEISISSKSRITPENREVLREFTQQTIGMEIIEERAQYVLLKDILDPSELPFQKSVRRIFYIVEGMLRDSLLTLKEADQKLADDVISRDKEVDKFYWLVFRQFNMLATNPVLMDSMKMTYRNAAKYLMVSRNLERLGDHAERIAELSKELEYRKGVKSVWKEIEAINNETLEILDKAVQSLAAGSLASVEEDMHNLDQLYLRCKAVSKKSPNLEIDEKVALEKIIDSLFRVLGYTMDIQEIVLNTVVDRAEF